MVLKWLSTEEVRTLRERFWPNVLPEKKPPSELEIFLSQLKSPLVYILLIAAAITFLLGEIEDTAIIALAVFINTILGYYQESKAGKALDALKKLLQATAEVIRDWKEQTVATEEIVPGDIVLLKAGEKIPADGKILEANRFFAMEAMLTGESEPIEKKHDDTVFMGTIVKGGTAIYRVETTGEETEVGKIALNIQRGEVVTPLQKQLSTFSKQLSRLVLIITGIVFVFGLIKQQPLIEIFSTAVALAVGAIPEGLLVALTVVLTIGMQKILRKKWLVKNLVSAETLGGVTVICSDKTGTLTHGVMRVEKVIGDEPKIIRQALLANDRDNAVALATDERAKSFHIDFSTYTKRDSIPFSSENKFTTALYDTPANENILFVNGAPEYLLQRSLISEEKKAEILKQIEELTTNGYRIVGYARKEVPSATTTIDLDMCKHDLHWAGFLALIDPIRHDVKPALQRTKTAWIKLIVITGDYAKTAKFVLQQLGMTIEEEAIMHGDTLAAMNDTELEERLKNDWGVRLFARTQPEQKMRIVEALKRNGEIVAMMGDGVNDAPALNRADIGIVVAEASDVSKESADLILLDSSFSTIVWAVEEGRGMFDNIRKIILYLMSDAFVAIVAIFLSMLMNHPLPFAAAQILWINLVSDGFPNLALTVDPVRKWIMQEPPRSPKERLVAPRIKKIIALVSVTGWIGCFLLFVYVLHHGGNLELARSVAYFSCGVNSLVYVFSVRTLSNPVRRESPFNNKRLLVAVLGGVGFLVAPFLIPQLADFLDIIPIGFYRIHALIIAAIMFMIIERYKHAFKHELQWQAVLASAK